MRAQSAVGLGGVSDLPQDFLDEFARRVRDGPQPEQRHSRVCQRRCRIHEDRAEFGSLGGSPLGRGERGNSCMVVKDDKAYFGNAFAKLADANAEFLADLARLQVAVTVADKAVDSARGYNEAEDTLARPTPAGGDAKKERRKATRRRPTRGATFPRLAQALSSRGEEGGRGPPGAPCCARGGRGARHGWRTVAVAGLLEGAGLSSRANAARWAEELQLKTWNVPSNQDLRGQVDVVPLSRESQGELVLCQSD